MQFIDDGVDSFFLEWIEFFGFEGFVGYVVLMEFGVIKVCFF